MNMKTLVIVMTLAFGMADVSHTSSKLRAKLGLGKLSEISSLKSVERSGSLSGKYELNDGSKVGVEFDDEGVSAVALNMTKRVGDMDTDIDLRFTDGKVAGTIAVNDGDGTTVTAKTSTDVSDIGATELVSVGLKTNKLMPSKNLILRPTWLGGNKYNIKAEGDVTDGTKITATVDQDMNYQLQADADLSDTAKLTARVDQDLMDGDASLEIEYEVQKGTDAKVTLSKDDAKVTVTHVVDDKNTFTPSFELTSKKVSGKWTSIVNDDTTVRVTADAEDVEVKVDSATSLGTVTTALNAGWASVGDAEVSFSTKIDF
jgi:hypothetical protein